MNRNATLCLIAPDPTFEAAARVSLPGLCRALAQKHPILFIGARETCTELASESNFQCLDMASSDDDTLVATIQHFAPRVTHAFGQSAWRQLRRIQHRLYSASALTPDHREPVPEDALFADLLLQPTPGSAVHPNLILFPAMSADHICESLSRVYQETVVAPLAGFQPRNWYHYRVIAKGANRVCVYADDNGHQCLKFLTAKGSTATVDPNAQEWVAYQRWQQRCDENFSKFFSPCIAMESTPHGEALRCELVCSGDGSLARPIYYYFSHEAPFRQDALHSALDQFEQYVHANRLPLFDLNAGNLLVVIESGTALRLVCADAKSLDARKELLPFSRWFEWARRRKVNRRFKRLHARIQQRWYIPQETVK